MTNLQLNCLLIKPETCQSTPWAGEGEYAHIFITPIYKEKVS